MRRALKNHPNAEGGQEHVIKPEDNDFTVTHENDRCSNYRGAWQFSGQFESPAWIRRITQNSPRLFEFNFPPKICAKSALICG
jgi:hypothetical protein